MSGKWLHRLLAHKGLEPGEDPAFETLETPAIGVLKVLRVTDLHPRPVFHPAPNFTQQAPTPLLAAYSDARHQMGANIPVGVATLHWDQALTDVDRFLALWGTAAADLGWPVPDIFEPPKTWVGGLAWELRGGAVVELSQSEAKIEKGGQLGWYCIPSGHSHPSVRPPAPLGALKDTPWRRTRSLQIPSQTPHATGGRP